MEGGSLIADLLRKLQFVKTCFDFEAADNHQAFFRILFFDRVVFE